MLLRKINGHLTGWRRKLLSFPAKLTLIKFVIAATPSYFFRIIYTPSGISNYINRLIRYFLWGGRSKIRWIAWSKACIPIQDGGLGLRKTEDHSRTLFAKQASKLLNNKKEQGLWLKFMEAKYSYLDIQQTGAHITFKGQSSWNWKQLWKIAWLIERDCKWTIGNGEKVNIW